MIRDGKVTLYRTYIIYICFYIAFVCLIDVCTRCTCTFQGIVLINVAIAVLLEKMVDDEGHKEPMPKADPWRHVLARYYPF